MTGETSIAKELAWLLALSTLWGTSYAFIKIGVETIPPVTLIAARTLIAGTLLVAVIQFRGRKLPSDRQIWARFLFQACLNSVVPFTLIAWAEQTTETGLATILNSTSPIFAFLLTALITRHEILTNRRSFGVAAGLVGTCLIVGVEALGGFGHELWAQLAIVAATICYSGAAIFGKSFKGLDPMMPAAGSLICGAAVLVREFHYRSPLDLDARRQFRPRTPCAFGLLDGAGARHLFPARSNARLGRPPRRPISESRSASRSASCSLAKHFLQPRGSVWPACWWASSR